MSVQLNLEDFTYDITKISIVTILEPLLGIIIACLPLFPAALKKVTGHMKNASPETRNVLSSSMARVRLKRSKNSFFASYNDSVRLTDLEDNKTHTHITGPSSEPGSLVNGCSQFVAFETPPQSSIKIIQDWEVRSDKARHPDAKL